jgi:hypothetical protein
MSFDDAVEAIGPSVLSRGMAAAAPAQGTFETALDQAAQPVAAQNASMEMRIAPPPISDGLSGKILDHLGSFYDRAQVWQTSGTAGPMDPVATPEITGSITKQGVGEPLGAGGAAANPATFDARHAAAMLEQAFAFAIETTLVSKASTESTRIFNTFLKGQ